MGLGKTVEIIDLILMHPKRNGNNLEHVLVGEKALRPSKGTVIITPPTIRIHSTFLSDC